MEKPGPLNHEQESSKKLSIEKCDAFAFTALSKLKKLLERVFKTFEQVIDAIIGYS